MKMAVFFLPWFYTPLVFRDLFVSFFGSFSSEAKKHYIVGHKSKATREGFFSGFCLFKKR